MSVPSAILELVERFDRHSDTYRSGQYNEAAVRQEFINPFFRHLGWDIENTQGHAEAYKEVVHEDSLKVGKDTKAPDYSFRIGGVRKFFLEAKRPGVNLKENSEPAFQLRRYAWSAKLPLSVLTDFEEFALYDCRIRPSQTDKASTARVDYLTYKDYVKRWDDIAAVLSRDAILKGAFDKYAESSKAKRGTATVDDEFLQEIERWRELLAKNMAVCNPALGQRELNYAVQVTIDRVIFLRICEDRGIEPYGQLRELLDEPGVYAGLLRLYRKADDRYNSGLFYFDKEKDRADTPDVLTPALAIDDKPLKDIIKGLYYPESPYEFSVLPADILGQVYEQFLGKVIRLTAGHHAVVEDKPEVKKAGGVYYTPTYVVDYIVKETVGRLLEGRTPKQAAFLRILDPACGSGSFLLGAYQCLLDWHRDYYLKDGPQKHKRELYQANGGGWRLLAAEKKRILLSSIFGVDIDPQAVEVTKLSLLLKVLEGENEQTLAVQRRLLHERALPDLSKNIQCGNSLIGTDYYDGRQRQFLDGDEEDDGRVNAFYWDDGFPWLSEVGGFDAVIGNPPWGAGFTEAELSYLRKKYSRVVARMVDSYLYFIDQGLRLLKASGPLGFIIPSTLLNQVDARPVRQLLVERGISALVSMGKDIFTTKVLNTSTILISERREAGEQFVLQDLSALPLAARRDALSQPSTGSWAQWRPLVERDPHLTFFVGDAGATTLLDRLIPH